jgi:hypothetical protein
LITEDPDYEFFCSMIDNAKALESDNPLDVFDSTFINLDNHSERLRYHVIKGFSDAFLMLAEEIWNAYDREYPDKPETADDVERFAINHNANLADIGALVNESLFSDDTDEMRDKMFEIHGMIYPNASCIIHG